MKGPINITANSRFAPSQWETSLQSNDVSHWLGANLESALDMVHVHSKPNDCAEYESVTWNGVGSGVMTLRGWRTDGQTLLTVTLTTFFVQGWMKVNTTVSLQTNPSLQLGKYYRLIACVSLGDQNWGTLSVWDCFIAKILFSSIGMFPI